MLKTIHQNNKLNYFLIFSLIVLSAVPETTFAFDNLYIKRGIKLVVISIFLFYSTMRFLYVKQKLFWDEILMILFVSLSLFSSIVINSKTSILNFANPFEIISVYIGISSLYVFLKEKVQVDFLPFFLKGYLFLVLTHLIFIVGYSYEVFFDYLGQNNFSLEALTSFSWKTLGINYNPNQVGYIMLVGLMIIYVYFFSNSFFRKIELIFLFFAIFFISFIMILSFSRGAVFSFILFFICALFFYYKNGGFTKLKKEIIYLLVFFLFSLIFFASSGLLYNFSMKFQLGTNGRLDFWIAFLKDQFAIFPDKHFWWGYGFTSKVNLVDKHYSLHNLYLSLWGRYGLGAMIIVLINFLYLLKKNYTEGKNKFIFIIPVIYLFYGLFETKIIVDNINLIALFFWFMILLPIRGLAFEGIKSKIS